MKDLNPQPVKCCNAAMFRKTTWSSMKGRRTLPRHLGIAVGWVSRLIPEDPEYALVCFQPKPCELLVCISALAISFRRVGRSHTINIKSALMLPMSTWDIVC